MIEPRHVAERILGKIDWQTEVSGLCKCPGEAFHTSRNGRKDCRVNVDGAPTIFCFHSSCIAAVAEANRRLRRALAGGEWTIALPGGRTLRSGDVLQKDGTVRSRGEIEAGSWGHSPHREERFVIEMVRVLAERFKPDLFEVFQWPIEQILQDSPMQVCDRDADDQFRTWLKLWPACSTVWIGDVYSSGKPEHRSHFRPVSEWYQIGPALGNFTCGSSFKAGSYQRSNENLNGHRFLVLESDTLAAALQVALHH
jgi:hypothetical protein